ncbi:hypothetical protein GCM10023107_38550 [Actinoplanes octamycinicus]|nr:hypothetical protein Aoc01nite_31750 [Actinoplanes octamycinicus]
MDLAPRERPGNVLRAGRETGERRDPQRPSCQTPKIERGASSCKVPRGSSEIRFRQI